jgi:ATP-dependent exoDNAse (exonuclease V) beta subunit
MADESGAASTRGIEMHEAWRKKREAVLQSGAVPMMKVDTATAIAHAAQGSAADAGGIEVRLEEVAREAQRPGSAAFGRLVHETILRTPFDAKPDEIGRIASHMARLIGAEPDADAAAIVVERAMESAVMRLAAAAPRVHREYPILFTRDDGTLIEGIADLAFEGADGRWVVVDFKTDRDLQPYLESYRTQLRLYVEGIRKATGRDATGVILWV